MEPQIGEVIKRLRLKREMQQKRLAYEAGLTQVAICRIERGLAIPRGITLAKLSRVLEVDLTIARARVGAERLRQMLEGG